MDTTLYREYILDLYRNPLNKKVLDVVDAEAEEFNPTCGDHISVQIQWDGEKIKDIGHQGKGCAISQAAISLLTEQVKGMKKTDVKDMTDADIIELLQIPIAHTRYKCATIGLHALKKIL